MNIVAHSDRFFIGDVVYEPLGTFGPRIQPHLQLVWVNYGEARLVCEAHEVHALAGEAFLMLPGERYFIEFDRRARTRHGWVDAPDRRELAPDQRAALERIGTFALTEGVIALADHARRHFRPESAARRMIGCAIFEAALDSIGLGRTREEPLPVAVRRAREWMLRHYPESTDLETIAKASAVSKAHLIRLFRDTLDTTPMRHLWTIRTEAAARLLEETGLPIGDIAERCGFPSPYHFSRRFKHAHGRSPSHYRRANWRLETCG